MFAIALALLLSLNGCLATRNNKTWVCANFAGPPPDGNVTILSAPEESDLAPVFNGRCVIVQ